MVEGGCGGGASVYASSVKGTLKEGSLAGVPEG